MGSKQTKIEEITLDATAEARDHRSHVPELEAMHVDEQDTQSNNLRRRFFKGFTYSLNDPRSPSILNRTPIVVDGNDKTLNLEDTFSDLLVDCRTPIKAKKPATISLNEKDVDEKDQYPKSDIDASSDEKSFSSACAANDSGSIEFTSLIDEETMACTASLLPQPLILQQSLDPRSPTIGLPRTPIVFCDYDNDENQEDAMLEEVLATLSIDLSSVSNMTSLEKTSGSPHSMDIKKPINKHLDRVKKPEKPIRKSKHSTQKQRIYLDSENSNSITPTKRKSLLTEGEKRTPLSCVKNRVHLRSRSVESNEKSPKPRLSLTSYDDSLNPVQNQKVINLHSLQGDSFDL